MSGFGFLGDPLATMLKKLKSILGPIHDNRDRCPCHDVPKERALPKNEWNGDAVTIFSKRSSLKRRFLKTQFSEGKLERDEHVLSRLRF